MEGKSIDVCEYGYIVDWEFLRAELLKFKGNDSYRLFLESIPGLGKTTAYRFITGERNLNLENLLIVVDALNLYIEHVIVEEISKVKVMP